MRRVVVLLAVIGCGHQPGVGADGAVDLDGRPGGEDGAGGLTDASPDGPPLPVCPPGQWCIESAPIASTRLLFSVFAVSAGDVFAVGDGGTIIRRQSNAWGVMDSGTNNNLRGVWASSGSNAWAVGENGTILHFDGAAWTPVTVAGVMTSNMNAVWGSSADDVWVVGTGRVFHWNGAAWAFNTVVGPLVGISGSGPANIWLATEGQYLKQRVSSWSTVMPGTGSDYYAVWAFSPTNVWAANSSIGSETVNWDGSSWVPHTTTFVSFVGLYGAAPNNLWGVAQSKVGHWDGAAWTSSTPTGVTNSLWGVSGAGAHVWAVGSDAMILHRN